MRLVYEQVSQVARTDTTVLIRGESGTGKELIAQAIHYNSLRSKRPFIKVSCAALPDTLIESELFGYEKGAFTGRTPPRRALELAEGARVLEKSASSISDAYQRCACSSRRIRAARRHQNDSRHRAHDCATNKDVEKRWPTAAPARICIPAERLPIFLPPLRERKPDLLLLADILSRRRRFRTARHQAHLDDGHRHADGVHCRERAAGETPSSARWWCARAGGARHHCRRRADGRSSGVE